MQRQLCDAGLGQPNSTRCVRQRTQANAAGSIDTFRFAVDPAAPLLSRLLSLDKASLVIVHPDLR
jgi:hypothetical protein